MKSKKDGNPAPHLKIVRNPALMPLKVVKEEEEKVKEPKKEMPKERTGYMKTKKHDFL